MRYSLAFLITLTLAAAAGCTHFAGRFDGQGFRARDDSYVIGYANPGEGNLASADWLVDNFTYRNGRPAEAKLRGDYEDRLRWPTSDGTSVPVLTTAYELRLSHKKSNGVIWVRVMPVPPDMSGKALKVVAQNWANGLTGSSTFYKAQLLAAATSKRIATKILESAPEQVGGAPAHAVSFELVDLDQLQLDQNAPRIRVRALFVAARVSKFLEMRDRQQGFETPGCLFLAYANDAAEFDAQLPEFEGLVARVRLRTP